MALNSSCRKCGRVCRGSICSHCKTIDDNKRLERLQQQHPHNDEYDSPEYKINRETLISTTWRFHIPCWICNKPFDHITDITADHVIPLSRGGSHASFNLRPAHMLCNIHRGKSHGPMSLHT